MQKYLVNLSTTDTVIGIPPNSLFKPTKLVTDVDREGKGTITGLYFNGSPQLLDEIDAWLLSMKLEQELVAQFLSEHGLTGKSDDDIDDYLDENELILPQSLMLILPTLRSGDRVRISIKGSFNVILIGMTNG